RGTVIAGRRYCIHGRRGVWPSLQGRNIDDFEIGTFDAAKFVVDMFGVPVRVGSASDVPGTAVVGEDEPVLFHGSENDLGCLGETGDVDVGPETDAETHARQIGIGATRSKVTGGPDIGALRSRSGEADRVADLAGGDFLVTNQAGEDGKARCIGGGP